MAELAPGTVFAGFRIERMAGRGGMGVVYRATQLGLGRPVALKLIAEERAADPAFRDRFERESRLTAAIDHPNVIPVYAAGEERGHLYLAMRYVAGTDLDALLRSEGRLAPQRAAAIVAQVAEGLDAAHRAGLVHRDVKPANVLLSGEHVYLSDFGITRVQSAETTLTESGGWVGSVDFMAPEHLRGERTDARSDVYALGCVLFAALTGAPPFHRPTVPATMLAHLHDQAPRASRTPGVPAAFDAVVARALAKAPADRYPSAGKLGRAAAVAAKDDAPATASAPLAAAAAAAGAAGARTAATALAPTAVAAPEVEAEPATTPAPTARPGGGDGARRAGGDGRRGPDRVHRPGRRSRLVALVVLVAVVAAAVLAVTGGGRRTGPLSAGEVRDAAQGFARAYADEDGRALRRLLTPGARRVSPTDVQDGRAAVVAEYQRQFAADVIEDYELAGLTATGGEVGRATAVYTVTRRGRPDLTGRLVLGVVRRDGRALIDLVATEPRA
jgi:hypothetical protein